MAALLVLASCGEQEALPDLGAPPTADSHFPDAPAMMADRGQLDGAPGLDKGSTPPKNDKGTPPPPPKCSAPTNRSLRIFFIGNSFTLGGPVPTLVGSLASAAGFPKPEISYSAVGGYSLSSHRKLASSTNGVAAGNWDFVVLQEYSTKPTDKLGKPLEFKKDATWFYDKTKAASPKGQVVLYETWARHPDHSYYPKTFSSPAQMQAQLRFHYNDAAKNYIPKNAGAAVKNHVRVAPVGDAWEKHLSGPGPLRLHASDNYHAGSRGQYLNALVIYSVIFGCRAKGASPLKLSAAAAARLQDAADAITKNKGIPPGNSTSTLAVGARVRFDFGPGKTTAVGWNNVTSSTGSLSNARTSTGGSSTVDLVITDSFSGTNSSGRSDNKLSWPASVSKDTLWAGSFSNHTEALKQPAELELRQLPTGSYSLELFASRAGKDGKLDRLGRYTIGSTWRDLDATDNVKNKALFTNVSVGSNGTLKLRVAVSPAGSARFSYLGALILRRVK